jgi:predicted nucleic acid-binding Zn ribbon protein
LSDRNHSISPSLSSSPAASQLLERDGGRLLDLGGPNRPCGVSLDGCKSRTPTFPFRVCTVCGDSFKIPGINGHRVTCSHQCSSRNERNRRRNAQSARLKLNRPKLRLKDQRKYARNRAGITDYYVRRLLRKRTKTPSINEIESKRAALHTSRASNALRFAFQASMIGRIPEFEFLNAMNSGMRLCENCGTRFKNRKRVRFCTCRCANQFNAIKR